MILVVRLPGKHVFLEKSRSLSFDFVIKERKMQCCRLHADSKNSVGGVFYAFCGVGCHLIDFRIQLWTRIRRQVQTLLKDYRHTKVWDRVQHLTPSWIVKHENNMHFLTLSLTHTRKHTRARFSQLHKLTKYVCFSSKSFSLQ